MEQSSREVPELSHFDVCTTSRHPFTHLPLPPLLSTANSATFNGIDIRFIFYLFLLNFPHCAENAAHCTLVNCQQKVRLLLAPWGKWGRVQVGGPNLLFAVCCSLYVVRCLLLQFVVVSLLFVCLFVAWCL